jgi:ElaB/YqjD/DUF883 family membrane-anchored ribosome-binding protein
MTAHVKDAVADRGRLSEVGKNETTLDELRKSVTEIANEVSKIAEKRARDVKGAAQAGTSEVRRSIRRQPVLAMGIAAAAGAVLALTLVPRWGGSRTGTARWTDASRWSGYVPQVTKTDLYDVADNIQRSVSRASAPVASSFERLVDAFSKIESRETINDVVEKAGSWFQKMRTPSK